MDSGDSPHEPIQVEHYKGRLSKHSYLQVRDVVDIDVNARVTIKGQISSGDWLRIYELHLNHDSQYLRSALSEQVSLQNMVGNFPMVRRLTDSDAQTKKLESGRRSPVKKYCDVFGGNAHYAQQNPTNYGTQQGAPIAYSGNQAQSADHHHRDMFSSDARKTKSYSNNAFTGQENRTTDDDSTRYAPLCAGQQSNPGGSRGFPQQDQRQEREASYRYGSRDRSRSPTRAREDHYYGDHRGRSPHARHENATYDGRYDCRETSHPNHQRVDTGLHYGRGHVEIDHPSDIHGSGNYRDQHFQGIQGRNVSGAEPRHSNGTHVNSNVQDQPSTRNCGLVAGGTRQITTTLIEALHGLTAHPLFENLNQNLTNSG